MTRSAWSSLAVVAMLLSACAHLDPEDRAPRTDPVARLNPAALRPGKWTSGIRALGPAARRRPAASTSRSRWRGWRGRGRTLRPPRLNARPTSRSGRKPLAAASTSMTRAAPRRLRSRRPTKSTSGDGSPGAKTRRSRTRPQRTPTWPRRGCWWPPTPCAPSPPCARRRTPSRATLAARTWPSARSP